MPSKKCKCKNCKCKIKVKQKATLAKNGEAKKDTLPKAPVQMPRDNGINMRIKIKRKQ